MSDNPNIDFDSFIPPVSDEKGHNIQMHFRCPPDWGRQVEKILKDTRFPYISSADVLRHALVRHFQWLPTVLEGEDIPGSVLGQIKMAQDLLIDDRRQQEFNDLLDALKERVRAHLGTGNTGQAVKHVLTSLRYIEEMPDGFWKDQFKTRILQEHGELLKGAPRVSLVAVGE